MSDSINFTCTADMSKIQLPPKMRKRGRPKGSGKTVIGLPKKNRGYKPVPFNGKSPRDKEQGNCTAITAESCDGVCNA